MPPPPPPPPPPPHDQVSTGPSFWSTPYQPGGSTFKRRPRRDKSVAVTEPHASPDDTVTYPSDDGDPFPPTLPPSASESGHGDGVPHRKQQPDTADRGLEGIGHQHMPKALQVAGQERHTSPLYINDAGDHMSEDSDGNGAGEAEADVDHHNDHDHEGPHLEYAAASVVGGAAAGHAPEPLSHPAYGHFAGDYLSDDGDDEPGGAQLSGFLEMSHSYADIAHTFPQGDDELESASESDGGDSDEPDYEATFDPSLGMHSSTAGDPDANGPNASLSDILGIYLQAGYPAMGELPAQDGASFAPADTGAAQPATAQGESPAAQLWSQFLQNSENQPFAYLPPFDIMFGSTVLAPANLSLYGFVYNWARQGRPSARGIRRAKANFPWIDRVREQLRDPGLSFRVEYEDLEGDACDLQGIDWEHLGTTRKLARERRQITYRNYVHIPGSDKWLPHYADVDLRSSESFFRFRRMDIRRNGYLAHFQLRNLAACTSRNQVFYTGKASVHEFNPLANQNKLVLNSPDSPGCPISTLDAAHGVLVGGNFSGEYLVRRLDHYGDDRASRFSGTLTLSSSAITNHVQLQLPRRSSTPQACFASNDSGLRLLDLATETIVSETMFPFAINCTAVSPDGQLRVMVGDHEDVLVVPADSNRVNVVGGAYDGSSTADKVEFEQRLLGHRDHGFACAWADDGHTIATGFQDRVVKIWDARSWREPLETIRTNMAGARSLRFSPVGSGRRVLVAAEEADYVNIIDASTFRTKQTVDFFGEIGGVAFEPTEGRDLFIFVADPTRGGIMQLERCAEVGALSDEIMHFAPKRRAHGRPGKGGDAADPGRPRSRDASWHAPPGQKTQDTQQQQQRQQQLHLPPRLPPRDYWPASVARFSRGVPTAPSSYDWPQDNMSTAARRIHRMQARRRHRDAILDDSNII